MRAGNLAELPNGFMVIADSGRSRAATMVLPAKSGTGETDDRDTASDQTRGCLFYQVRGVPW